MLFYKHFTISFKNSQFFWKWYFKCLVNYFLQFVRTAALVFNLHCLLSNENTEALVSVATNIQKPNCLPSNSATIIPKPQLIVAPDLRSAIMKTPFCYQGSTVVARQRNRLSREAASCAKSTFVATVISVTKCLFRVLARPTEV